MYELEHHVTETYPELSAHFIAKSIHTSMYASSRFLTYFTTALSLSLACCIFDVFLMEDMEGMLKFFQKELLGRAENKPDYLVNLAYSMKINTKRMKKLQVLRAEEEETTLYNDDVMIPRICNAEHTQHVAELTQKISLLQLKNEKFHAEGELNIHNGSDRGRDLQNKVVELKAKVDFI